MVVINREAFEAGHHERFAGEFFVVGELDEAELRGEGGGAGGACYAAYTPGGGRG